MVRSRKILAYLLTFTLLVLGLPTVNAGEVTLLGEKVATNAGETSLTVSIDSPTSKFDPSKQYTLPRSGLTLLPSAESKYASGSDLFNLYKSEGLYSYAPVADRAELVFDFSGNETPQQGPLSYGFCPGSPPNAR